MCSYRLLWITIILGRKSVLVWLLILLSSYNNNITSSATIRNTFTVANNNIVVSRVNLFFMHSQEAGLNTALKNKIRRTVVSPVRMLVSRQISAPELPICSVFVTTAFPVITYLVCISDLLL